MNYETLKKIYYKDKSANKENWSAEYHKRFTSSSARHFPLEIRQLGRKEGYPAFLCYTERLAILLQDIYEKQNQLSFLKEQCPSVLLRQQALYSLVDEIQSTNDIEGVRSTRKEIRDTMENRSISGDSLHLMSVIKQYEHLINRTNIDFRKCSDIRHFYDIFVLDEVVSEHPKHRPDGQWFRADSVSIETITGKEKHRGLMPESAIIEAMQQALSILHDESIPFLVRLAVFHYLFEYIHPFYDGNGRTGRFIISYFIGKRLDLFIGLRLSVIINKYKKQYYDAFDDMESEWNRGELTSFVIQFLEWIQEAYMDTLKQLTKKRTQLLKYERILDQKLVENHDEVQKALYKELFLSSVFSGAGATVQDLMKSLQKSRGTILSRLKTMPRNHLLIIDTARPYRYRLNMMMLKQ